MVGTSVATDSCAIQWYRPFQEPSVIDLGPMGYELESGVAWDEVMGKLDQLLRVTDAEFQEKKKAVLAEYKAQWRPDAFAKYIIQTCQELA